MPSAESAEAQMEEPQDNLADYSTEEKQRIERIIGKLEDDYGMVESAPTRLTSALRMDAIRSEAGAEFSVDEEAMRREAESYKSIFSDPVFRKQMIQIGRYSDDDDDGFKDEGEDGGDCDDDSVGVSKFERKRRTMQDAFPGDPDGREGLVFKRTRKFGCGARPPPGALVTFHYSLYKEVGDINVYPEPFDCTRQHFDGRPYNKRLGADLIPGIDWALSTMCKGERSQFYIHPRAFLGDKGAMERIPGGVPVLADIEMINFCDSASVDAFYSKDEEERRQVPFKVQLGVVQCLRQSGNELYKKSLLVPALHKYRSAETVLTTINITSDTEEKLMLKELSALCTNKALTLYKLARFPSVVRECNEALKLNPQNAKALLWKGEALCSMGNHEEAAAALGVCQRLTGGLSCNSRARVEEAVLRNNDMKREYLQNQRQLYRKMGSDLAGPVGPAPVAVQAPANDGVADELSEEVQRRLEEFAADPTRLVLNVPTVSMSEGERRCLLAAGRKIRGLETKVTPATITFKRVSFE